MPGIAAPSNRRAQPPLESKTGRGFTMRQRRFLLLCWVFAVVLGAIVAGPGWAEKYQKPPQAILDAMNAPNTPSLSVSPTRDRALVIESPRYPTIADLAQPMLR